MGELFSKSSPIPLQKLSRNNYQNGFLHTDRRSTQAFACFCYRKRLGTAETLSAKRVVWRQSEPSERPVPTKFVYPIVGTGVLDGPTPLKNIAYKNGIALAIPFSAFYSTLFSSFFLSKRMVPMIAEERFKVSPIIPPQEKKMML